MLTAALALGALLAVAAVAFVARPLLRPGARRELLPEPEQQRLAVAEERDRALAALKELEFDHRTGKVSDDDYRTLVGELRKAAADALRALDAGKALNMTNVVVPEPQPEPSEPPGPVIVPEPEPVPHEPPGPVIVPEPTPPDPNS